MFEKHLDNKSQNIPWYVMVDKEIVYKSLVLYIRKREVH